jgi:ATP-dependent exoDNAse (exonuclease V) alpha subunit
VQVEVWRDFPHLNPGQQNATRLILNSRDTITALDGLAGSGKTTALAAVRAAAEASGYVVEGIAPTTTAAKELAKAGMVTQTLQRHVRLAESGRLSPGAHLYVLDESSLASTVQIHALLNHLTPQDRVLLVGDTHQHQSVEAGRIYEQLIEQGLQTGTLTQIIRQKDPAYLAVVERVARGDIGGAVRDLDDRGLVVEIPQAADRLQAVAEDFCTTPEGTLVIAPDNLSRQHLNEAIHAELTARGVLTGRPRAISVLVERQDTTGADRGWASRYEVGDVLRYSAGSDALGITPGSYARVEQVDTKTNRLTVRHESGGRITYNPDRLRGVSLYQEETRLFAVGERVQFKQPFRDRDVANGELGIIQSVTGTTMRIKTDRGRTVAFALKDYRHLDYGFAVTSYSSQSLTERRVILHINTDHPAAVDRRLTFVAFSRGTEALVVYTNDRDELPHVLNRENSHRSAIERSIGLAQAFGVARS